MFWWCHQFDSGPYHKHNCIILSIIHHHHFKQLPRAIWFWFSYIYKSCRHRYSTKGSGGQDTTILFTYDQDIMNCKKQDSLKKRRWNTSSKTFEQPSFTEAPPLGPRWDSAPPRISHRVRFQGGRRRRGKFIRSHIFFQNSKREKFGGNNQSRHPWWSVATRTKLTEAAACNKSSLTCYLWKGPPNPQRHWTLDTGAPGTSTTGVNQDIRLS